MILREAQYRLILKSLIFYEKNEKDINQMDKAKLRDIISEIKDYLGG